jgi:hypothetical protein
MKKLILLTAMCGIAFMQLKAQEPSKTKVDPKILKQDDYKTKGVIKDISKVAPMAGAKITSSCCAINPYVLTPCAQSLIQSFKNLIAGTGVRNCHPTLNFPSVSFAMPENCFARLTTSASMVTYSSFYIPKTSEFRVIWGGNPANFSYYGVCPPDPIIYPHPGGATENHVFGAMLIMQSDYMGYKGTRTYLAMSSISVPISDIQEIVSVYMEDSGGYASTGETSPYNNIESSIGIVVKIRLRGGGTVLCYIINNYDGAGTLNWKERNPACAK